MNKHNSVKQICVCAMCIALCVVLPKAFAWLPNGGKLFSPMHIPVLLCGLVCGGGWGALCGALGILLGALTGTPPMLMVPRMMPELIVYGLTGGLAMRFIRTGSNAADVYISLALSMLLGRVAGGIASVIYYSVTTGVYSLNMFLASYFVEAVPAILLHIALIPVLVLALSRARLVPVRYQTAAKEG